MDEVAKFYGSLGKLDYFCDIGDNAFTRHEIKRRGDGQLESGRCRDLKRRTRGKTFDTLLGRLATTDGGIILWAELPASATGCTRGPARADRIIGARLREHRIQQHKPTQLRIADVGKRVIRAKFSNLREVAAGKRVVDHFACRKERVAAGFAVEGKIQRSTSDRPQPDEKFHARRLLNENVIVPERAGIEIDEMAPGSLITTAQIARKFFDHVAQMCLAIFARG